MPNSNPVQLTHSSKEAQVNTKKNYGIIDIEQPNLSLRNLVIQLTPLLESIKQSDKKEWKENKYAGL